MRLRKKSRSRLFQGFCFQNKNKLVCEINLSGFILCPYEYTFWHIFALSSLPMLILFHYVQVRRVWREKEQEESSFLPERHSFHDTLCPMYTGIVQNDKSFLFNTEREFFLKNHNLFSTHIFHCGKLEAFTIPINHGETIHPLRSLREYTYLLIRKLPSIRDIAFRTYMRLITIIQIYFPLIPKAFQFSKFLKLIGIKPSLRFAFRSFSYPFISSAKLLKKWRKVSRLVLLLLEASHSALAACKFCRSFFIAERTVLHQNG